MIFVYFKNVRVEEMNWTPPTHCTWEGVIPEKKLAKQMAYQAVIRNHWTMQKCKNRNHIMTPFQKKREIQRGW